MSFMSFVTRMKTTKQIIKDVLDACYSMNTKNISALVEAYLYLVKEEFYDDGQKKKKIRKIFDHFGDGNAESSYESWHENGNYQMKCLNKNDVLWGECEQWYENGNKELECTFEDGLLHSAYKRWYKNGQIAVDATFFQGSFVSLKEYNENGQIMR
jgi:antitoxin component YwqK of YwqJK toxin-antitoxin module